MGTISQLFLPILFSSLLFFSFRGCAAWWERGSPSARSGLGFAARGCAAGILGDLVPARAAVASTVGSLAPHLISDLVSRQQLTEGLFF